MTTEEIKQVSKEENINVDFGMGFINITSKNNDGGFAIPVVAFENMTFEVGKQFLIDLNEDYK